MDRWTLPPRWKKENCNGYFIRLGQQLGAESLLDAAKAFGFGQSLLLAEGFAAEAGQLPTPQELAQSGQLANFSFGQGSLLATPMQVAALFNTLAADGVYRAPPMCCKPRWTRPPANRWRPSATPGDGG